MKYRLIDDSNAVVGKKDGTAHGGHLLAAHIRRTREVMLTESGSIA